MTSAAPARVLLVAHRTAATPRLLDEVRARARRSPCSFTLLVPRPYWDPETEEAATTLARPAAARRGRGWARRGPSATRPVRHRAGGMTRGAGVDEIIISSPFQRTFSRWLHLDLPHRVQASACRHGHHRASARPRFRRKNSARSMATVAWLRRQRLGVRASSSHDTIRPTTRAYVLAGAATNRPPRQHGWLPRTVAKQERPRHLAVPSPSRSTRSVRASRRTLLGEEGLGVSSIPKVSTRTARTRVLRNARVRGGASVPLRRPSRQAASAAPAGRRQPVRASARQPRPQPASEVTPLP